MGSIKIKGATSGSMVLTVPDTGADNVPVNVAGLLAADTSGKLEVIASHSQLRLTDSDDNAYTQFSSSINKLAIRQSSTSADHFWLTSAGKVGIGTSNPTEKLDVAGTVKATSFVGDGSQLTGISTPEPKQLCKAWINFNGEGSISIQNSYNFSSLNDHGTGYYAANMATAMPNNDYSVTATAGDNGTDGFRTIGIPDNLTTTKITMKCAYYGNSTRDCYLVMLHVMGD